MAPVKIQKYTNEAEDTNSGARLNARSIVKIK
jgi:hypothetical protein